VRSGLAGLVYTDRRRYSLLLVSVGQTKQTLLAARMRTLGFTAAVAAAATAAGR